NPLNTYGISKLAGEHLTASKSDRHLIIRTSGLFGLNPCRGKDSQNFVEMFIGLVEGNDCIAFDGREVFTMTSTENLSAQIEVLVSSDKTGLFHAVSEGECSLYQFGEEIISLLGSPVQMEFRPLSCEEDIARPDYTPLENRRLDELGMNCMKHWKENLRTYLKKR
ncbi:MAG: sugar nucleotide-binding protein, partial [Candidatus Paceibacteria bacterium]